MKKVPIMGRVISQQSHVKNSSERTERWAFLENTDHVDEEFKRLKQRLPAMESDLLLHSLVYIVPLEVHECRPNEVWSLDGLLVASMEIRTKFNIAYKMSREAIRRAAFLSVDREGHVAVDHEVNQYEMSESELAFLECLPERVIAFEHHPHPSQPILVSDK